MTRISHEDLFMRYATLIGMRGTCNRARVGAVLVFDQRPISSGYVGSPPGQSHCLEVGCDIDESTGGCTRTTHAEANAIAWAARAGIRTNGSTLYTTHSPCRFCSQIILAAGVSEVVYGSEYRESRGLSLLRDSAVIVRPFNGFDESITEELPWQ